LHAEMLAWYRRLIELRRTEPALADGLLENVEVRVDEATRWLVLERGPLAVVCNLASEAQSIPLGASSWAVMLSSTSAAVAGADSIRLPADSVAILKQS